MVGNLRRGPPAGGGEFERGGPAGTIRTGFQEGLALGLLDVQSSPRACWVQSWQTRTFMPLTQIAHLTTWEIPTSPRG